MSLKRLAAEALQLACLIALGTDFVSNGLAFAQGGLQVNSNFSSIPGVSSSSLSAEDTPTRPFESIGLLMSGQ